MRLLLRDLGRRREGAGGPPNGIHSVILRTNAGNIFRTRFSEPTVSRVSSLDPLWLLAKITKSVLG